MSVPLAQEKTSEAALVVFTLLVPASVGLATFSLIGNGLWPAIAAIGLATAGMIGSIAHLAKPLRAPTSLRGLRSSWLSREIAAVSLYWGCLALWLLRAGRKPACVESCCGGAITLERVESAHNEVREQAAKRMSAAKRLL